MSTSIAALRATVLLASLAVLLGLGTACSGSGKAVSSGGGPDGGACSTNASPGCNCPNAGKPYSYTVALDGDPTACGLSATAGDNSQVLCSQLCGGCFSQIGSTCHLTSQGGANAVQCDVTCPFAMRRTAGPKHLLPARAWHTPRRRRR
jgi:hypothetical protein